MTAQSEYTPLRKILDEDGKPYSLKGTPRYVEIEVQDIAIKEAIAFRPERGMSEDGKQYYNYRKQPYIHLEIKKHSAGGRRQLYILDRKVAWDLLRCFDSEINYRLYLQLIEEFSLYQILEDFFHDYRDETIGLYFQQSRARDNTTALNYVVVGLENRVGMGTEDLGFHEVEQYIMGKLNLTKAHHLESFMTIVTRNGNRLTTQRKKAVARYKQAPYTLEVTNVCGTPYNQKKRNGGKVQGNTQMRLFIDSKRGRAQVIPVVHWAKQLEFVESEKFYSEIDKAIEIITSKVFRVMDGKNFPTRWTVDMTLNEWDAIQHQNFLNCFNDSE